MPRIKVAAAHVAPVFLELGATIEKTCSIERTYDLAHTIRLRAGAHSFEAKAFNIVASGFMDTAMFDFLAGLDSRAGAILEASPRSVSLITGPHGTPISDERCDEEGIVYADLDLAACVEPKQFHDVSGGYNRFDIFHLTVNRTPHRPIQFASICERKPQAETRVADEESTDSA